MRAPTARRRTSSAWGTARYGGGVGQVEVAVEPAVLGADGDGDGGVGQVEVAVDVDADEARAARVEG